MSDDLVKRLRQPWDADRSIMSQTGRWMVERKEAADRIEELEAKLAICKKYRDAYAECDKIATQAVRDLEAKLAKAVEELKFYAEVDNYEDQHKPESCGCCYYLHDAEIKEDQGAKARTTLAELTGGKDER